MIWNQTNEEHAACEQMLRQGMALLIRVFTVLCYWLIKLSSDCDIVKVRSPQAINSKCQGAIARERPIEGATGSGSRYLRLISRCTPPHANTEGRKTMCVVKESIHALLEYTASGGSRPGGQDNLRKEVRTLQGKDPDMGMRDGANIAWSLNLLWINSFHAGWNLTVTLWYSLLLYRIGGSLLLRR